MFSKFLVDSLYWQAHHIVIAAVKPSHADIADPLLNTIGTSLIERTITVHVVMDLFISQCFEGDICCHIEATFLFCCEQTHACRHLMRSSTEQFEHPHSISLVNRFA